MTEVDTFTGAAVASQSATDGLIEALDYDVAFRTFQSSGDGEEHFIVVAPPPHLSFHEQLQAVQDRYTDILDDLKLSPASAIFRRVFLSDVINQAEAVRACRLATDPAAGPVAVSIVQQPPASGAKIMLLAYHVTSRHAVVKQRLSPHHLLVTKNGLRHLWSTGLCAAAADTAPVDVEAQTHTVFRNLIDALASQNGLLRDHCIRTWIYLKDVDVFYRGMVHSRTALFATHGLNTDTHYIASTGIQGACAHRLDLVAMDAYSALDVDAAQIRYLNDFDHLCATKDYNVTFERGTCIAYRDRAHYFISGTASIDNQGCVVHSGDVRQQLMVALDNVDALLRSAAADLGNLMYLIVYLRDPTDFPLIAPLLRDRVPGVPIVPVQGAVCRPEWLVEIEGVGIGDHAVADLPDF